MNTEREKEKELLVTKSTEENGTMENDFLFFINDVWNFCDNFHLNNTNFHLQPTISLALFFQRWKIIVAGVIKGRAS